MNERPEPDIERVRRAMHDHDERVDEDEAEEAAEREDDEDDERSDD
jgi:hypothetical protein